MDFTHSCRVLLVCLLMLGLGSASVSSQRKKQIAVLDFDFATVDIGLARRAYGTHQNLARHVAERMINSLVALGTVQVIERSQLEKILREQNLGGSDRIDPATAAKVGRILGVDVVVIGDVSIFDLQGLPKDNRDTMWDPKDMRARIAVNFRIVNTTTGVVELSNEMIGLSAQGPKQSTGERFGKSILDGINKGKSSQRPPVKDEQIRDVVEQALDDVIGKISSGIISGNFRQPPAAVTAEKPVNGRVISVNDRSLVITNVGKSDVRVGDRLFVRRFKTSPDKWLTSSVKVGEVEVVEIQDDVIIGSFSGSGSAQVGDVVTNSPIGAAITGTPKTGGTLPMPGSKAASSNPKGLSKKDGIFGSKLQPTPTPEPIERFPVIECLDTVAEAKEFAVQVFLALERRETLAVIKQGTPTPSGRISMPLPAQADQRPWKIEVVLAAPDFEFTDKQNIGTMLLHPLKDSTPALFHLKLKPGSRASATAEISATLWHAGDFLGQISRTVKISRDEQSGQIQPRPDNSTQPSAAEKAKEIIEATIPVPALPRAEEGRLSLSKQSDEASQDGRSASGIGPIPKFELILPKLTIGPKLAIDLTRRSPDLTIRIKERFGGQTANRVEIEIHSPHLQTTTSTFEIGSDVARWLESQYETFAKYGVRDLKQVEVGSSYPENSYSSMLQGFGRNLYEKLAPPIFQDAFWKLADKFGNKFTSIQIISDNPTIPWELMRPVRSNGKGERGFLGVEFSVGRQHLAEGVTLREKPPQSLTIDSLSVIAPQYSDKARLRYQSDEVQALQQMRGYRSVGGRFPEVQRLFAGTPEGIIHFAGHAGVLPNHSTIKDFAIQLEDGPLNITVWQGLASQKLMSAHPFFFFNACHIGQTQRVANFVNGWAPAVLDAGASGYVGALWPINDRGAYEFAARFYEILAAELKRGPISVAEVLRQTRANFLKNGDPTFLAYVYYGDPNLTFYAQRR